MRRLRIAIGIGLAASFAEAFEIKGQVVSEADGSPVAGALVRLVVRGDSALTDSAGSFKMRVDGAGLHPQGSPPGNALRARVHAGMLEYAATSGTVVRIDLYGTDGKFMRSLRRLSAASGIQKISLSPITAAMHGMGWLRVHAEGRTEWVRILSLGAGMQPVALARQGGPAESPGLKAAALAKADREFIDTLRVEKRGYYPNSQWMMDTLGGVGTFRIVLWKNPSDGLDPAEVEAWKAHLTRPVVSIRVGPFGIGLPGGMNEWKVVLADGTEADTWWTSQCLPGPRPIAVRLAYARQGREYRDTVLLAPLWKLLDSYRTVGLDSLNPYADRFHLAWDWPKGFSAVPERDWIELSLIRIFSEDHTVSYPDVFQIGIRNGIEGGVHRYGAFDPAGGVWSMQGSHGARTGIKAEFTLARREDHDLRIVLEDWAQKPVDPVRFSFVNTWPEGGLVPAEEVLHPQAKIEPATASAMLELIPEGAEYGPVLKYPWNGSALAVSFPFPIRDTLSFRLKAWETDEIKSIRICQVPAFSPVLRAIPSPKDSAVHAFEPNEKASEAALVPLGQWIEAAWDFRPQGDQDADHYRFQASAGSRIRLSLRNPNPEEIILNQTFSDENSGFFAEPVSEMTLEYVIKDSSAHAFSVRPYNFPAGHYSFRIDPVP